MVTLEDRVAALETRVDELALETRHAFTVGVTASRDALTAREAHQHNIELLNALRETQAEHTQTLAEHSRMHDEHRQRFDAIDGKLAQLAVGMHTVESLLRRALED